MRVTEPPDVLVAHIREHLPLSVAIPPLTGVTTMGDAAPAAPDGRNVDTDRGPEDRCAPRSQRTDGAATFLAPHDESHDNDGSDTDEDEAGRAVPRLNDEHTAFPTNTLATEGGPSHVPVRNDDEGATAPPPLPSSMRAAT